MITSREHEAVLAALLTPRYNYGVPRIVIRDVLNNMLYLEHLDRTTTFLDRRFAAQTLAYIAELWKHPVLFTDQRRAWSGGQPDRESPLKCCARLVAPPVGRGPFLRAALRDHAHHPEAEEVVAEAND